MKTGLNMRSVKAENRRLILHLLQRYGALSRKELSEKSSLTSAAVTIICNELISEGKLCETGELEKNGKGRKEILLSVSFGDKYVLCVNAETTHITYSICSFSGELKAAVTEGFTNNADEILEKTEKLLYDNNIKAEELAAAGVCVVGSVSGKGYGLWNCSEICKKIEEKYSVPVTAENNIRAFAQSEMIYSDGYGSGPVLFFKWGPGIGSAVAAGGELFSRNDEGVAEIGHYIVNPAGKACRCGRWGCLETEAGEEALVSLTNLTLPEIVKSTDENVIHILDEKIDIVALALTNTATILNAEKIVLFGSLFSNETVVEKLRRQCIRYNGNLSADMIIKSKLNEKIGYAGPAAICAKKFFFDLQDA
ncbi:MAG: ROK family transcriptional regulator [Oscillospiraceae bacterium]|nr:ROK family transcriptional regulator [Oscillospiraceae bacterium]